MRCRTHARARLANDVPKGTRARVRDANKGMMRYPEVRFADLFLTYETTDIQVSVFIVSPFYRIYKS